MAKRIYPHNRIRYWYTYEIDEICALYADFSLHPQTVRKWVKQGLQTIDKGKPTLIYGYGLIQYLRKKNTANKTQTAFNEMFCMSCQDARPILRNEIAVEQKARFLKVQGVCLTCKANMFKNYKMQDLLNLRQSFKLIGVSELYDDAKPSVKTHIHAQSETLPSESLQGELF